MKTLRPEQCSPSKTRKRFSCYSNAMLYKLKHAWNVKHSDKITGVTPKQIWIQLTDKFPDCIEESCWSKKLGVNATTEFAPKSPKSWNSDPDEWLSSTDITNVLKQYEKAYDDFKYIGPSPSDFDVIDMNECVWPELCKFNIHRSKPKVGIVFNLDEHEGPGTHWVSLFIDKTKRTMYYFDSTGDPLHPNIKRFTDKVKEQDNKYKLKQSRKEHQKGNTECGVYSLFFISTMLKYNDFSMFTKKGIFPDSEMLKLRKKFFNES
jgi:hypothetical protein